VVFALGILILCGTTLVMGQGTLEEAKRLNNQVRRLSDQGKYEEAIPLAERALEIRTRTGNVSEDSDYFESLLSLASLYSLTGRDAKAIPLFLQVAEIARNALGPEHPAYATTLNNLADSYRKAGHYEKAEPLFLQAAEIRRKVLGSEHPDYARSLHNLAILYYHTGRYDKAEPLLRQAEEIFKKSVGAQHPAYASSLTGLATLYLVAGRYDEAEPLYLQAAEIFKQALGAEHHDYATSLTDLAELYRLAGRYDKAGPLYLQAAEIFKKALGAQHAKYASSLNNLAAFYKSIGRDDKAESLYLQAAEIFKKALGPEHADYATSLNNLAELYEENGSYDKAEPLYLQATEIFKKALGADHPTYAASLHNLAELYGATRRFDKAEPLMVAAAEIYKKGLGAEHPDYARSLNSLSALYFRIGRYDKAEPLVLLAAEIRRKVLGAEHQDYASSLKNLAVLYEVTGRSKEAFSSLNQAMNIEQTNLRRVFGVSSEAAMSAYLSTVSGSLDSLVSIAASQQVNDGMAGEMVLKWSLRRKGIILDTLVQFREAQLLAQSDPTVAASAARLRFLRQQMSNLPLNRPVGMSDEEMQQQMKKLGDEADQLEADLNRKLAAQRQEQPIDDIDVPAVRKKLPANTALIEFVRSEIYQFKATGKEHRWKPAHYFAFAMTSGPDTPVRMIDLGLAGPIDDAIKTMRTSFVDFGEKWKADRSGLVNEVEEEKQFKLTSKKLYDLVFAPLRKELSPSIKMVYLAPDDQLNLVPFDALVDSDNKYLIDEGYRFAYLSSGRDLLRSAPKSTAQATVVVADPDYDMATGARAQKAKELLAESAKPPTDTVNNTQVAALPKNSSAYSSTLPDKVQRSTRSRTRNGKWDSLPASPLEAQDVERELMATDYGPVKEYLKGQALEEVFKQIRSPRVLHVSTHGFFPEQSAETETKEGPIDLRTGSVAIIGQKLLARAGNPLLQSGLVLAGANSIGEKKPEGTEVDDGWVTADEIAMMNLQGTELVVLSACGSGLGAVSAGEGVYGLRRAFQNAGAQTIVSTLFEVPDKESREIMRSFYEGLKNKKTKLDALHEAQLRMIAERRKAEGAAHPFFWASFVLTGNPE
jgi:CHAT domain-containing protein/Flp pilus assembly protein TadD